MTRQGQGASGRGCDATDQAAIVRHRLEAAAAVSRYVEFYVAEYNATIPHAAFAGQPPDEIYFGRGEGIPAKLEAGRRAARARRLKVNRAEWCERCHDLPGSIMQGVAA